MENEVRWGLDRRRLTATEVLWLESEQAAWARWLTKTLQELLQSAIVDASGDYLGRLILRELPELLELAVADRARSQARYRLLTLTIEPVDLGDQDTTVARAIRAEARRIVLAAPKVSDRYVTGYQAGYTAFEQRVEQRAAEIEQADNPARGERRKAARLPEPPGAGPSTSLQALKARQVALPPDRNTYWRGKIARVLESSTVDAEEVAATLLSRLPLRDFDHAVQELAEVEAALRAQCRRPPPRWQVRPLTEHEYRWRYTVAEELQRQAGFVRPGTGRAGDDFVTGFNAASNRIAQTLRDRAHEIATWPYR
jgi:hypothetical protein